MKALYILTGIIIGIIAQQILAMVFENIRYWRYYKESMMRHEEMMKHIIQK